MTAYVVFLIFLWLCIFVILIAAGVVLLALFGGGAALCAACRRLTGLKPRCGEKTEAQTRLLPHDKGAGH